MSANDGGPAFPRPMVPDQTNSGVVIRPGSNGQAGMSLRDYFASQALSGAFARLVGPEAVETRGRSMARAAYFLADQMLAIRGEPDLDSRIIAAVEALDEKQWLGNMDIYGARSIKKSVLNAVKAAISPE